MPCVTGTVPNSDANPSIVGTELSSGDKRGIVFVVSAVGDDSEDSEANREPEPL